MSNRPSIDELLDQYSRMRDTLTSVRRIVENISPAAVSPKVTDRLELALLLMEACLDDTRPASFFRTL